MAQPLELMFLDKLSVPRIRKHPPFRAILDEALRAGRPKDMAVPPLPNDDIEPEDRADVFLILARAAPAGAAGTETALSGAIHEDGKRAVPLVLAAGELTLPFDDLAVLKATVTTAMPFAAGDEALTAALAGARDFLETPGLLASSAVTEVMTNRIREAFRRGRRAVPPEYLLAQAERALVEQRRFQSRSFLGKPHLRALLSGEDRQSMLVYLPLALASSLPLAQRFGARLVALVHPLADQLESFTFALQPVALARCLPSLS